ncbi:MAG: bifunctional enoyl-CoA hydratase/phosphate acetyltransferase [Rhodothermaceae bacterium]
MHLKSFDEIFKMAKGKETKKIAVASAADKHALEAVKNAITEGIVEAVLFGDEEKIKEIAGQINFDLSDTKIVDESNPVKASALAVAAIKNGEADVLMKGNVSTGPLLKVVLDKEKGLRKGGTLSHVALMESPYYHKLLCVTDAAVNVAPELKDKVEMINNAVEAFHKLGIEEPKVAVIGAVEVVNPKMEATSEAALLTMMNKRKQIKGCIVDGPLALDNAVSKEAAEHKGIVSEVAGDCDIMLTHDINSGNVLYKSLNFLGGATAGAVIMGAAVPIVLTSRSDSEHSKLCSIALAAAMDK